MPRTPMLQYMAQGACMGWRTRSCLADSLAQTDTLESGLETYRACRSCRGRWATTSIIPHDRAAQRDHERQGPDEWYAVLDWLDGGSGLD
jgi:2-polyprenyl-6-methoxyphenol hydroxylase-like FAD-dependent oxidoreductase